MCEELTAGERTASDKDNPSRSVTRLLDRKVLTGVTWGEGAGSTGRTDERVRPDRVHLLVILSLQETHCFIVPWWPQESVTVIFRINHVVFKLTIIEVEQRHFHLLFLALFLDRLRRRFGFRCLEADERNLTWIGADFYVTVCRWRLFQYRNVWFHLYLTCQGVFFNVDTLSIPSFSFWLLPQTLSLQTLTGCFQTRSHLPRRIQTLSRSSVVYSSSQASSHLLRCSARWKRKQSSEAPLGSQSNYHTLLLLSVKLAARGHPEDSKVMKWKHVKISSYLAQDLWKNLTNWHTK